jgi:hypothetical protein
MGYTHYWRQKRPFTPAEWATILAESKRIVAKAKRGEYYTGKEDFASATKLETDANGFRVGFNEDYAWRTFAHPEVPPPMKGAAIKIVNGSGKPGTQPEFDNKSICLNGVDPDESYETFLLERAPKPPDYQSSADVKTKGIFNFCKTEYRPYDAVVVSILQIARCVAPDAITVTSDGGDEAIKLLF